MTVAPPDDGNSPPAVTLSEWMPTAAHLRAVVLGVAPVIIAIAAGRADLLVVAVPLLVVAAWGVAERPTQAPTATQRVAPRMLREGDAVGCRFEITADRGADHAVVLLADNAWIDRREPSGVVSVPLRGDGAPAGRSVALRVVRWGPRTIGPAVVAATSSWGAYRCGPTSLPAVDVVGVPLPAVFDNTAPLPNPTGVVGLHHSSHQGDGAEFAGIRPFQAGDRLRRIHWPVSLRAGALHVTATYADRDTEVLLLIDGTSDVGESAGIDGAASSLDLSVRAAGALGQHFLHRGDRVGVRSFGTRKVLNVPPAGGVGQLRRIVAHLARVEAGRVGDWHARRRFDHSPRGLVVVLTPMCTLAARELVAVLAERRLTLVVVDTMPERIDETGGDDIARLAWRIRLIERRGQLRRLSMLGAPVVPWRGPGSLDHVLRDLARNARAPRRVRR